VSNRIGFDPNRLDKLIHSPIRLGIVAALHSGGEASFTQLRQITSATDGNLTIHLQTLETHGVVSMRKRFVDRRPRTSYRLTAKGRRLFGQYIECMARMVKEHTRPGTGGEKRSP